MDYISMTLEQIAQGLEARTISYYKNNPKESQKAKKSLLEKPLVEGGLVGSIFYRQPSGKFTIIDGNTRWEYVNQRLDWEAVKYLPVQIAVTDSWDEAKEIINIKQKHVRGCAPLNELALNTDFPCGKLVAKIKRTIEGRIGDDATLVYRHIQKSPQHMFDIIAHLKNNAGEVAVDDYNVSRNHAQLTTKLVNAGPTDSYSDFVSSEWEARIADALEAYAVLLAAHAPRLHQNPSVDKLLGVGKGNVNPGFWVTFMLDHMAAGKGSFGGFSMQGPKRLLQHLRAGSTASNVWEACAELLRSQPAIPRMAVAKTINKYLV